MVSAAAVITLGAFAADIKASPEVICCAESVVAGRVTTEALTAATKFATVAQEELLHPQPKVVGKLLHSLMQEL